MDERTYIAAPLEFLEKLQEAMRALYRLFELAGDPRLPIPYTNYDDEYPKPGFQVSSYFDRPSEFLQSLLDVIRVNYEPWVLGTLLLNSNLAFLYSGMPREKFQLGYISITNDADKPFAAFWKEVVIPYVERCGYSLDAASATYVIASTGSDKYNIGLVDQVYGACGGGFSVDEAMTLLASCASDSIESPRKEVYAGFCLDPALAKQIRVSLWLFFDPNDRTVQ